MILPSSSITLLIFHMKFWQRFTRMWIYYFFRVFSNVYTVSVWTPTINTIILAQMCSVWDLHVFPWKNVPSQGLTPSVCTLLCFHWSTLSALFSFSVLLVLKFRHLPMWLFFSTAKTSTAFNLPLPSSFETSLDFFCFSKLIASDIVNSLAKLKNWDAYCPGPIPAYHRIAQSIFLPVPH